MREAAQHDAQKARQALIQPVDEPQNNARLGLAQALKKLAEAGKRRQVIGLRLCAPLNDREPLFRIRLVDLGHKRADALPPIRRFFLKIELRIVPCRRENRLEAHQRFVDRKPLVRITSRNLKMLSFS